MSIMFKSSNSPLIGKVVVLSIVGAFREGKSFMLNFFLKYLNSLDTNSDSNDSTDDWMVNSIVDNGFEWKSSSNGCTQGILMWNKPFCVRYLDENEEEQEVYKINK